MCVGGFRGLCVRFVGCVCVWVACIFVWVEVVSGCDLIIFLCAAHLRVGDTRGGWGGVRVRVD